MRMKVRQQRGDGVIVTEMRPLPSPTEKTALGTGELTRARSDPAGRFFSYQAETVSNESAVEKAVPQGPPRAVALAPDDSALEPG